MTTGDEEARIKAAIEKTRAFFEQMQVPTRLSAYGIGKECISRVQEQLSAHGMVQLGEHRDVTPQLVGKVLELCLSAAPLS